MHNASSIVGVIQGTQIEKLAIEYVESNGERIFVSIKVSKYRGSEGAASEFAFPDFAGHIITDRDCKIMKFRNIGCVSNLSTVDNQLVVSESLRQ
jgi:hypothetical protein